METFAIWTKDLTKKFGDFIAVNKISIEVERGSVYGFIGANGSGKTTTIRMLCGILDPTSGEGKVAGFDILKDQERIKENIGYMSQKFSLYGELTIEENIDFYSGAYRLSNQEKVNAKKLAYEITKLESFKNLRTRDLPVGWKQRLALACALLHNPKIVFLDEPTAGVDPISRREFWDLIYELSEEGITIFVTTHFLDEAEYCSKIGLINNGKIVAQDSPSKLKSYFDFDLYEINSTDYLKLYEVLVRTNIGKNVSIFGTSIHIVVEKYFNIENDLLKLTRENNITINSVTKINPSLEDAFINFIEFKKESNDEKSN